MHEEHEAFIRESIALSRAAMEKGNEPFGTVLVKGGQVILRAENTTRTKNNITHHAETNLVQMALAEYTPEFLNDCTLYTSTEPCAMCSGAIYWSGVGRVVFACSEKGLQQYAGIGLDVPCRMIFESGVRKVEVIGPVLEEEALQVHAEYW